MRQRAFDEASTRFIEIEPETMAVDPVAVEQRVGGHIAEIPAGERVYAVGDIHGRLDLFLALVARILRDNEERGEARLRIILLGDLVDRGPESAGLVDLCRAVAARSPAMVVLKGNHEAMMVDALRGNLNALALWLRSGGEAALRSWGVPQAQLDLGPSAALVEAARQVVPIEIVDWLDARPLSARIGDYLFVHAGIRPGVPLKKQSPQDMLWIRRDFLESAASHAAVIVHGHSIVENDALVRSNRIGIDTGAYRTSVLTAVGLERDRRWFLSTSNSDVHAPGVPGRDVLRLEDDLVQALETSLAIAASGSIEGTGSVRVLPRRAVPAMLLAALSILAVLMLTRPPEKSPMPPIAADTGEPAATVRIAEAIPDLVVTDQTLVPSARKSTQPSPAEAQRVVRSEVRAPLRTVTSEGGLPPRATLAARSRSALTQDRPSAGYTAPGIEQSLASQVPSSRPDEPTVVPSDGTSPPANGGGVRTASASGSELPTASPQQPPAVSASTPDVHPTEVERRIMAQRSIDAIRSLRRQ